MSTFAEAVEKVLSEISGGGTVVQENIGKEVRLLALKALRSRLDEICDEVSDKSGVPSDVVRPTVGLAMIEYGISGMFQLIALWPVHKAMEFSATAADAFGKLALGQGKHLEIVIDD